MRIEINKIEDTISIDCPFSSEGIKAGFPSPAQDCTSESIDLNKLLIKHKESTFYARVSGNSLCDAGINDGDLVIIDKALTANTGDYVVAYVDGEFTLKQFKLDKANKCAWLLPANKDYKPIKITEDNEFLIWGVLTTCIKNLRK